MRGHSHIRWFFCVAAIVLATALFGRYVHSNNVKHYEECKGNVKAISFAVGRYRADHNSRFPSSLTELVPVYLAELPNCPVAGEPPYLIRINAPGQARPSVQGAIDLAPTEPTFTVWCDGPYHMEVTRKKDEPSFTYW